MALTFFIFINKVSLLVSFSELSFQLLCNVKKGCHCFRATEVGLSPSLRLCRCLHHRLVKYATELLSFYKQREYGALGSLFRQPEYLGGKNISETVLQANHEKRSASRDGGNAADLRLGSLK